MGTGPASLISATLDLQLVRLLRKAMAANASATALVGPAPLHLRRRIEPEPHIEPRQRIEPEPRIEPRKRIEPEPRIEPRPVDRPAEPEMPLRTRSPLEPPWAVRAWEIPAEPAPKIKIITYRPDLIHKGSLIDLFI